MKNAELKAFVESILTASVKPECKIEFTQHGNGYCVCVRAPHSVERYANVNGVETLTPFTEYGMPATFKVFGIQTEESIKKVIYEFLSFYGYLTA